MQMLKFGEQNKQSLPIRIGKTMNILVLSWRDHKHPQAGGAEQVMHEHMKGWVGAGHKVTLFSSRVKGLSNKETFDGIEIVRKGDQYFGVKIAAFFFWLRNKENYDFVVDQFHGLPFFTPLYVNKPKLAVLQEVAGKVWFLNEFPFPFNWIVGLIGYLFEPIIFLFYRNTHFMVGSESAKADLENVGIPGKNITIIPHGVVIKKLKRLPVKGKIKTVVFLGALTKDKGIEDALKTFSYLAKLGNYNFWVIGKGGKGYEKYLLNLTEELGIKSKVIFWGFVSEVKKFELLAKAHLLINPSVREGWGLVNIEANAMRTPVVAYKSAGLIDSVKDGVSGLIIRKNTPQELTKTVINILTDIKRYQELREGAISWSKRFSWNISREKSLNLINRVFKTNS